MLQMGNSYSSAFSQCLSRYVLSELHLFNTQDKVFSSFYVEVHLDTVSLNFRGEKKTMCDTSAN